MAHRTVILRSNSFREEAKAAAATIYPGMCIYWSAADTVAINNVAGRPVTGLMVAIENALTGDAVDDVYASGARVQFHYPVAGDYFALRVKTSENIAFGDNISVDNAGDFVEAESGESVIAIAMEAPGALTADTLVKCLIINQEWAIS